MYKYLESIKSVKSFELDGSGIYYSSGKNVRERTVYFKDEVKTIPLTKPTKVYSINNPSSIWINTKERATKYKNGKEVMSIDDCCVLDEYNENQILGLRSGYENFFIWNGSEIVQELPFSSTIFTIYTPEFLGILFKI